MGLNQDVQQLQNSLKLLRDVDSSASKKQITNFKAQQINAARTNVDILLAKIESELQNKGTNISTQILSFKKAKSFGQKLVVLETISEIIANISEQQNNSMDLPSINLPSDVRDEMSADIYELKRCFTSECYRSSVVLCGRLLETALHRKYFEVANNDLLEKSPGMGLGNLIAKMEEKGIKLDPGLTNQIHLVNQVRIYSVHKKQQPFNPGRTQANAIILYTFDVLKKLFQKG